MAANDDDAVKQIFSRCLLNCFNVDLWSVSCPLPAFCLWTPLFVKYFIKRKELDIKGVEKKSVFQWKPCPMGNRL